MTNLFFKFWVLYFCLFTLNEVHAARSATILVYHHVSDSTPPSTTISPEKFAEHMAYLKANHQVISLTELVDNIKNQTPLPENAVAITFDDGFSNIKENAHPLLLEHDFPYTIFVNPSNVGVGGNQLTWQELKELKDDGVLIANHYWDHRHLLDNAGEDNWLDETRQHILAAEQALVENLGSSPRFLAYPFGEYNPALQNLLKELNIVGFAQHSGAVGYQTDLTEIPRFPAAGIYANLNSLKTKIRSLAMPVQSTSIKDPVFYTPPKVAYQMTINTEDFHQHLFTCYFRGEKIATQWQGNTVQVETDVTLQPGRSRVNCTAPSKRNKGRFYWHSQPFFVATKEGKFLD